MKKTTMALLAILSVIVSFAQAPQTFKYQAVARDNGGNVLINQNVSFQIAIIWDLTMYIPSYYETHTSTTSELGLVILEVGNGTATFGVFDTINWSRGN